LLVPGSTDIYLTNQIPSVLYDPATRSIEIIMAAVRKSGTGLSLCHLLLMAW